MSEEKEVVTPTKMNPIVPLILMGYTIYALSKGDAAWMFPISQFGSGGEAVIALIVLWIFTLIPAGIIWGLGRLMGIPYWNYITIIGCILLLIGI